MKAVNTSGRSDLAPRNYYTGVGSRSTPVHILDIMTKLAVKLSSNYILRSGGAGGADLAFEKGAAHAAIYYANDATEEALRIAESFHPAWNRCSDYVKKLHARNVFQVLGSDLLDPSGFSKFLICWTPDGAISHQERTIKTGGTGTAISIAIVYNVPIYNLQRYDHFILATTWLNK